MKKGQNYKPFNEMQELKQVLYGEEDEILPIGGGSYGAMGGQNAAVIHSNSTPYRPPPQNMNQRTYIK